MKIFLQTIAWLIVVIGLISAFTIAASAPGVETALPSLGAEIRNTAAHDAAISLAWGVGMSAVLSGVFFGALSAIIERLETLIACVRPDAQSRTIIYRGKEIELRPHIEGWQWVANVYISGEISHDYEHIYQSGLRSTQKAAVDYLENALVREEARYSAQAQAQSRAQTQAQA